MNAARVVIYLIYTSHIFCPFTLVAFSTCKSINPLCPSYLHFLVFVGTCNSKTCGRDHPFKNTQPFRSKKLLGIFEENSFISVFQIKFIKFNDVLFSKVAEHPPLKLMETMAAQRPQISSQNVLWAQILLFILLGCQLTPKFKSLRAKAKSEEETVFDSVQVRTWKCGRKTTSTKMGGNQGLGKAFTLLLLKTTAERKIWKGKYVQKSKPLIYSIASVIWP